MLGVFSAIILLQAAFLLNNLNAGQQANKEVLLDRPEDSLNYAQVKSNLQDVDKVIGDLSEYFESKNIEVPKIEELNNTKLEDGVYLANKTASYAKILEQFSDEIKQIPLGIPAEGRISSKFGIRKNPFLTAGSNAGGGGTSRASLKFHSGLDIAVPTGTNVKATAEGTVIFAGQRGGYGNAVIIKHENGLATLYGHLSRILVKANQKVAVGDVIAKSGNTGNSTGPHIHYEVRKNDQPIDPEDFINI